MAHLLRQSLVSLITFLTFHSEPATAIPPGHSRSQPVPARLRKKSPEPSLLAKSEAPI